MGIGFGPGTSEYGLAFAKISSFTSAVGATWDRWRLEKGHPVEECRTFLEAIGAYAANERRERPMAVRVATSTARAH